MLFEKDPAASKVEVINDIDDDLVNLFDVVQSRSKFKGFVTRLRWLLTSRTKFEQLKRLEVTGLSDVDRAVRFFYLLKLGFGGRTVNPSFGYSTVQKKGLNTKAIREHLAQVHDRLNRVYVEHLDFEDCVGRYDRPGTFFYCDPPYYDTEDYRHNFADADHARLAAALRKVKGKFLLSYNDHPAVRKLYRGCTLRAITARYSISLNDNAAPFAELLIASYPLPRRIT